MSAVAPQGTKGNIRDKPDFHPLRQKVNWLDLYNTGFRSSAISVHQLIQYRVAYQFGIA